MDEKTKYLVAAQLAQGAMVLEAAQVQVKAQGGSRTMGGPSSQTKAVTAFEQILTALDTRFPDRR